MLRKRSVSRGVIAEFASPEALIAAIDRLAALGYERLDTFTPFPVKEVEEKITSRSPVALVMLIAAMTGAAFGYLLQWWCAAVAWPLNIGGRPLHSAPAFVPIAFESAVLFASLAGFVGLFAMSRLPRLHHAVFEVEGFERATIDRFWLAVDAADDVFDPGVKDELASLGALRVADLGGAP